MDKKSKEVLRRYKKSRKAESSSESSSSSDSDSGSSSSYSSSDSERRHRHKKTRQPGIRRSTSSSGDERHKRDKERRCQKKLEAKRNHLKRKLKEAKLKKKAAVAAAALSGHSHRALSPATQAKLKKLAERKHLRAASKERREREKEKHRALKEREREHHHHRSSRSPTKLAKIRLHQEVNRQKTPPRVHHQLMSREKIIIQTRTRDRTPSAERERLRLEHKMRHDELARERERREREAAREKERAEALARCQERQRERERLAREKLRREEEEKYGKPVSERLLARGPDREIGRGFESRERSLERVKRSGGGDIDPYDHAYIRKHRADDYDEESERRAMLEREELLREREYMARRREISPNEYVAPSSSRMRADPRDLYPEDDRDRSYSKRPFVEDDVRVGHSRDQWLSERELRAREMQQARDYREIEPEHLYPEDRERLLPPTRDRERPTYVGRAGSDWKRKEWPTSPREWPNEDVGSAHVPSRSLGFGAPKRGSSTVLPAKSPANNTRDQRPASESDWDAEEGQIEVTKKSESTPTQREQWLDHEKREITDSREKLGSGSRSWGTDWRDRDEGSPSVGPPSYSRGPLMHHPRADRGGRGGYRRGGHILHGERVPGVHGFRPHHPPALLSLPTTGAFHEGTGSRFPNKRNMTYTNPNILKKQQAALAAAKAAAQASAVAAATTAVAAAKAAAQSAAGGTANPSILGQTPGRPGLGDDKPEAGEIVGETDDNEATSTGEEGSVPNNLTMADDKEKKSGELSEISDSDDDILNKTEKKARLDNEDSNSQSRLEKDSSLVKPEDDDLMDFEEISDGELEEERAARGVGDALGVDWSSLVADTKRIPSYQTTTAKQKWQPHRIILDVGISMRMAGEEYAKSLLDNAKLQLDNELRELSGEMKIEIKEESTNFKTEIKDEVSSLSTLDDDSQAAVDNDENTLDQQIKPKEEKTETKHLLDIIKPDPQSADDLPELACMQVAQRKLQMEHQQLIATACGMNSRALSARQDLKLRRQLCGLPARECPISRNIPATSDKLKAMALAAFQRTLEVK